MVKKLTREELDSLSEDLRWLYRKAYKDLHVSGKMRIDRIYRRNFLKGFKDEDGEHVKIKLNFANPEE